MDDHDGARSRRDAAFELCGIHVVGVWADVGENGLGAKSAHGATRGHKSERREKDFVSWLNTARAQRQNQRVGSGSKADAVSDAAEFGDFFSLRGAFASQDKLLGGHHALDGGSNLSADGGVLRGEIELRHGIKRRGNLRM